jgi:hypothetical protein
MDTRSPARRKSELESDFRISRWDPAGIGLSLIGILLTCSIVAFTFPALAQSGDSNEYRLKLAFLYNFAQFVQWPLDSLGATGEPLCICVAGDNPFAGQLEQSLDGRAVAGHPIALRSLQPGEDPHACRIIFVRSAEMKAVPRILASIRGLSILTVGEAKGFAEHGGMINLTQEENRLRFEINLDAAQQSRLKISSKLLALAKIVQE